MQVVIHIFLQNILPVFILIFLGFILSKKFKLDIQTLTKLNFYLFIPAFAFTNLYITKISIDALKAMLVAVLILIANFLLGLIISKMKHYDGGMENAFQNALMFYNSGNIGIPLITLVFSTGVYVVGNDTPYLSIALTTQIMVFVVQNISVNTIGFFNAGRANSHWKDALMQVVKMPAIYAVLLAFLLKMVPYDITQLPIWPALVYIKGGLVPMALTALGIQLAKSKIQLGDKDAWLATAIRLILGPAMAFVFIHLLQIDGIVAQALFISSAVPTAVNTALIAVECKNHPDYATHVVILSTVLSSVTMIAAIFFAGMLFPLVS